MLKRAIIFLLPLSLLVGNLQAREITLDSVSDTFPIGRYAEYLEDTSGHLAITDVSSSALRNRWKLSEKDAIGFGLSTSAYWLRFQVENKSVHSDWVIQFDYPHLDYVTLFIEDERGHFSTKVSGRMFPLSVRDIKSKTIAFSTPLRAGETRTIYLRVASASSLKCDLALWRPAALAQRMTHEAFYYGIYFGVMLIMALYNLSLYLAIADRAYFLYGIYVMLIGIARTAVEGLLFEYALPENPAMARLIMIPVATASVIFGAMFALRFLDLRSNAPKLRYLFYALITASLGCGVVSTTSYSIGIRLFALLTLVAPLLLFIAGVISWRQGYRPAKYFLIAWSVFLIASFGWGLGVSGLVSRSLFTERGVEVGTALEVLLLSLALADRYNLVRNENEAAQRKSLERQTILTQSYARFVPEQMFSLLEKSDVTQVSLGDATQTEITILFSDIRSFTTLSESMTPQENFDFLNAIMKRTGPVIRENHGFVDKFIGDAIMALFPRSPEDAIQAAIQMKANLRLYNVRRTGKGLAPLKVGIGINTGNVILGTVGEPERMDATVISDTVNLASRIEGLTKYYDAALLVTEQTLFRLSDPMKYNYRMLERVQVKGKKEPVAVFEIFDGDSPEEMSLKIATQRSFEHGVQHHLNKAFVDAIALFKKVLDINPADGAAKLYLQRSEHYARHGAPPDWSGVAVMENK